MKNEILGNKLSVWQTVFCFVCYFSAMFFVKINVPFTNSGELTVYMVEFIGLLLGVYLVFYILKNYKTFAFNNKILFWSVFVSQIGLLAIYVVRVLIKGIELKSILIFESNLFVLPIFFLVILKIISLKSVIYSLNAYLAFLGILSVALIYLCPAAFTDYVVYNNPAFYVLTFGNPVRTYLLLICFPIVALCYYYFSNMFFKICFFVNLCSLIFCSMISGARVNYICVPLVIALICFVFMNKKAKNRFRKSSCTVIVSFLMVVLVFSVSIFSKLTYTQLMRLDITRNVITSLNIEYYDNGNITEDNDKENNKDNDKENNKEYKEMLEQALVSADESASSRSHMWRLAIDDIKKAPFFGEGLKQYDFKFNNGVTLQMQAHNFILEYLLSFGIVGFILWVAMILMPEIIVLRKEKFKFWKSPVICFTLISMMMACFGAFFQPYFLFPGIMFFVFVLMACYYEIYFHIYE